MHESDIPRAFDQGFSLLLPCYIEWIRSDTSSHCRSAVVGPWVACDSISLVLSHSDPFAGSTQHSQ